jgi:hypothetical protein
MSEKFAFSSMLHLVWAVVLILGMGFVHFYMSMIATSFDPCPDNKPEGNIQTSIDKSVKYFDDIKMVHLGIAIAIILAMLIGRALTTSKGKMTFSILTIVLKFAACLIVVFGVSHAQNILKLRNKQCNNTIDEAKIRELKILIEACIGSIGVIIGNYLSLGINNLISFRMDSNMSIIITIIVCILLVCSIIGGDALISIFKKELNIKNECLALNEELSKVDVSIGPANNLLGGILPDQIGIPTTMTFKDHNVGKIVISSQPYISTTFGSYEPGTNPSIVIKFTAEQVITDKAFRIIFPKEFKMGDITEGKMPVAVTGITTSTDDAYDQINIGTLVMDGEGNHDYFKMDYDATENSLTHVFTAGLGIKIANGATIKLPGVTLPQTLGFFVKPIQMEILAVPQGNIADATVEEVSYNNYFDLKDDFFVQFNSLIIKDVDKMSFRIKVTQHLLDKLKQNGEGLVVTLPEGNPGVFFPEMSEKEPIKIFEDHGYTQGTTGKPAKGKEYGPYYVKSEGTSPVDIKLFDGSMKKGFKQFRIKKEDIADNTIEVDKFINITVPILSTQEPRKFPKFIMTHDAGQPPDDPNNSGTPLAGNTTEELTHNHLIEFIDPRTQKDTTCPVLSRDLFMKIFLTSVMTGWAVSTIVYLSGDLYEHNATNMEIMLGGGSSGEVNVVINKET